MKHLRIGRQLRCEPAESAAFRLISPCIKLFLQDFNDNDEISVHFVAERATHTPFRCVFIIKFDKYKEDICNLRLDFAIAQKEVAVIPITADGLGREFLDFDFDKVFSGGAADFPGVFLLIICRNQRRSIYHNGIDVCRNALSENRKSRCSELKTAGFAFGMFGLYSSQLCQMFCTSSSSSMMSMSFSISLICSSFSSFW